MGEIVRTSESPFKIKERQIIAKFNETRFPELVTGYDAALGQYADLYGKTMLNEPGDVVIPEAKILDIQAWLTKQSPILMDVKNLLSEINQAGQWIDVVPTLVKQETKTGEIKFKTMPTEQVITPSAVAQTLSRWSEHSLLSPTREQGTLVAAQAAKVTRWLEKNLEINEEITVAATKLKITETELQRVANFLLYYDEVRPRMADNVETRLVREQLRLTLLVVTITPDGWDERSQADVDKAAVLYHRLTNVGEVERQQKEMVQFLGLKKLEIAQGLTEIKAMIDTYIRLHGERHLKSYQKNELDEALGAHASACQEAVNRIDGLVEGNHLTGLSREVLESEILAGVTVTRSRVHALIKSIYRAEDRKLELTPTSDSKLLAADIRGNKSDDKLEQARNILGIDYLGPESVARIFGIDFRNKDIPPIPFSLGELRRAKELNQFLVLRVNKTSDDRPLTIRAMLTPQEVGSTGAVKEKLFEKSWYKEEYFAAIDTPTFGWALVGKDPVSYSRNKDYWQQTEILVQYIKNEVFAVSGYQSLEYPDAIVDALVEYEQYRYRNFNGKNMDQIEEILSGDPQKYAKELAELSINQLTRQKPVEVLYDRLVYDSSNGKSPIKRSIWTNCCESRGYLVSVNDNGTLINDIDAQVPSDKSYAVGVVFSRSL